MPKTVAEIITDLQQLPQNMPVYIDTREIWRGKVEVESIGIYTDHIGEAVYFIAGDYP